MRPTDIFSLKPLTSDALKSSLLNSLNSKTAIIEGQRLEAQFELSSEFLIITSDGDPFEDSVHFTLLDSEMKVLDCVSLGQIYQTGSISHVSVIDATTVAFRFFNDHDWMLRVRSRPLIKPKAMIGSPVRYSGSWLTGHRLELSR